MAIDRPPLQPQNDPATRCEQTLWIWQDGMMIKRRISFVPCLYSMYEQILVNAAGAKLIKVTIDVNNAIISVWNDGEERVPSTELWNKANRFCTNFTIETADGYERKKQVFTNKESYEHRSSEKWTKVSFKPDLAKFGMGHLEDDTVALMKRRVVDLAGCLGNSVKVELDGTCVQLKTFEEYVQLYLQTSTDTTRIYKKVNDRWEVCICIADGEFEQVSFINYFATLKGGSHVDYITSQVTGYMARAVNLKPNEIKSQLWVFVNALIDNPAFDSQTKESLTTNKDSFGSTCKLSLEFLKKTKDYLLKKKAGNLEIRKLTDAALADTALSQLCTLILTEGDSALPFARLCVSSLGRKTHGLYPLKGKLINAKKASHKEFKANTEMQNIMKILGLQDGKKYENVNQLRYGRVMLLCDQDHDGSHIKGLFIAAIHQVSPSLLKIDKFLSALSTPLWVATHNETKENTFFYTHALYGEWKENMGERLKEYTRQYVKGVGGIPKEAEPKIRAELDMNIRYFYWENKKDDKVIEQAFSNDVDRRKRWLKKEQDGRELDLTGKRIRYLDFFEKEIRYHAAADKNRSIHSAVDGLKSVQRKIIYSAFKNSYQGVIPMAEFIGFVLASTDYYYGTSSVVSAAVNMAQSYVGSNNINLLQPEGQLGTRYNGGKDHSRDRYIKTRLNPIARYLFHKDDDLILNYMEGERQSVEPAWFVPIIPLILVNGCNEITFGYRSFVPNYNPKQIIANLKRLLKDQEIEPMRPWYKGFSGDIWKTPGKNNEYTTEGKVTEGGNGVMITELPIFKWPKQYKKYLRKATGKDIEKYTVVDRDDEDNENYTVEDRDDEDNENYTVEDRDDEDNENYTVEDRDDEDNENYTVEDRDDEDNENYTVVDPDDEDNENYTVVDRDDEDNEVRYKLFMNTDQLDKARNMGFVKQFKLTSTLSTAYMLLLDANGEVKKYDTPEEILEDFYHLRLEFYEKRKTALLRELKKAALLLENTVRYIFEKRARKIMCDEEDMNNTQMSEELKNKGFKSLTYIERAADRLGWDEANEDLMMLEEEMRSDGYGYLLNIKCRTVKDGEVLKKLEAERDEKKKKYEELTQKCAKEIWLEDLTDLDEQLENNLYQNA